jgi:hypothetical protein
MKLRYYSQENKISREEVELFAATNQLSMMDAKQRLQNKSGYCLQYWDGHLEQWFNVPYVTEYRP